jgi:hypothetical protein
MIVDTLWIVIAQLVVTLYLVLQVRKLGAELDSASVVIGYILMKTSLTGDELVDKDWKLKKKRPRLGSNLSGALLFLLVCYESSDRRHFCPRFYNFYSLTRERTSDPSTHLVRARQQPPQQQKEYYPHRDFIDHYCLDSIGFDPIVVVSLIDPLSDTNL